MNIQLLSILITIIILLSMGFIYYTRTNIAAPKRSTVIAQKIIEIPMVKTTYNSKLQDDAVNIHDPSFYGSTGVSHTDTDTKITIQETPTVSDTSPIVETIPANDNDPYSQRLVFPTSSVSSQDNLPNSHTTPSTPINHDDSAYDSIFNGPGGYVVVENKV